MIPTQHLVDNPILIKHMRSRLRRSDVISTFLIVGVLLLLITWHGIQTDGFSRPITFTMTLILQGIILLIAGSSQVAASVSNARASGILDFHRISPLPPTTLALGFLLGAPIREYLAYLITLPVSLVCVLRGGISASDFLCFVVLSLLVAWALHAWTMVAALYSKKPSKNGPIGLLVFLGIMSFNLFGAFFSRFGGGEELPEFLFFGVPLPWLLFASIYLIPTIFFGVLVSTRKIRSERAHPLSKVEAVAFLVTTAILTIGGLWPRTDPNLLVLFVLYALVGTGVALAFTITPSLGEYARGVRRATRLGLRRLPFWDDLALNRSTLALLCVVASISASLTWNIVQDRISGPGRYSLAIAVGVLTVAYVGLAAQYFALTVPKRSATLMVLFLFFIWVVPLIASLIAAQVNLDPQITGALTGFTPLTGLAFTAAENPFGAEARSVAQVASLVPAVGFTSLFFFLVTAQRRKIDKSVREVMLPAKPTNPFDFLESGHAHGKKVQTAEL